MNKCYAKQQRILLKMVKDFHILCKKNNLTYYMLGGTFLGAIRHKGFIPWDDDIDVGMPRDSYNRFVALPESELPPYLVRMDKGYGKDKGDFLYTKLVNNETTLVENINEKRIQGVYIDVFPIDGAGNSRIISKLLFSIYRILAYSLWFNASERKFSKKSRRLFKSIISICDNRLIYKSANKLLSLIKYDRSEYVGNYMGNWGYKEIMKKEILGTPRLYTFEDTELYGPENEEDYLIRMYGNYLELPPIEKRGTHHTYEYINLDIGFDKLLKEKSE